MLLAHFGPSVYFLPYILASLKINASSNEGIFNFTSKWNPAPIAVFLFSVAVTVLGCCPIVYRMDSTTMFWKLLCLPDVWSSLPILFNMFLRDDGRPHKKASFSLTWNTYRSIYYWKRIKFHSCWRRSKKNKTEYFYRQYCSLPNCLKVSFMLKYEISCLWLVISEKHYFVWYYTSIFLLQNLCSARQNLGLLFLSAPEYNQNKLSHRERETHTHIVKFSTVYMSCTSEWAALTWSSLLCSLAFHEI